MAREVRHFPDQTGSRWEQWALTAFRSPFTRVVRNATGETLAASAAPSTQRHAIRFAVLALSLVATAQGYANDETDTTGASLAIPPVLTTESGYQGGRLGRNRLKMFAGGSNDIDPEQRLIEALRRERERGHLGLDVTPARAADNTTFKRALGGDGRVDGVSQEEQGRAMGGEDISPRRRMQDRGDGPGGDGDNEDDDGGGDGGGGGDDGDEDDDNDDGSENDLLLIVSVVVGCGVMLLVILCVVRKVMDLCLLRYDPTGSISYSQEEGLSRAVIERLPQTRYKKPQSKLEKAWSKQDGRFGTGASVFGEDAVVEIPEPKRAPDSIPVPLEVTGEGGAEAEARDSTEDMCAICLVDYENGDELRVIPGCKHHFHKECIDPWLETKAVCAYCKVKVEPRKSCCDRLMGSTCNRLGIRFAAPTTIRFSSSRRTYTNQEVNEATGPHLPPSYGQSDVDYVGSMVGTMVDSRPADTDGGDEETGTIRVGTASAAAGGELAGIPGSNRGSTVRSRSVSGRSLTRSSEVGEDGDGGPQGSIVVQPVAGSSFLMVPRDFSTAGSAGSFNSHHRPLAMSNERAAAAAAAVAASRVSPPNAMVEGGANSGISGDTKEDEKGEEGEGGRSMVRTVDRTVIRRGSERLQRPTRGRNRGGGSGRRVRVGGGVRDGLGGVVFGGNTQEFKEAEAEDRARQAVVAGEGVIGFR